MLKGVKKHIEVPCTANVEGDIDEILQVDFICRFKRLTITETKETMKNRIEGDLTDVEIVRRDLHSWKDMPGDDGEDFPFTEENLEAALDNIWYLNALVDGWKRAQLGRDSVLEKN